MDVCTIIINTTARVWVGRINGKLYAVGGSDGTHSLSSTEIFDEESQTWVVGPNLTTPRANVSVVSVAGKLYAIGGFAGKFFLNTVEYLDMNTNEWTTFVKQPLHNRSNTNSPHEIAEVISRLQSQLNDVFLNAEPNTSQSEESNGHHSKEEQTQNNGHHQTINGSKVNDEKHTSTTITSPTNNTKDGTSKRDKLTNILENKENTNGLNDATS